MDIKISKDVKDCILRHQSAITVDLVFYHWGSGGQTEFYYYVGRPNVPENYNLYNVDGVDVYVFKAAMIAPEGISITKSKRLDSEVNIKGLIYDKDMPVMQ